MLMGGLLCADLWMETTSSVSCWAAACSKKECWDVACSEMECHYKKIMTKLTNNQQSFVDWCTAMTDSTDFVTFVKTTLCQKQVFFYYSKLTELD